MITLPYGSKYIGLFDDKSDDDTRTVTEENFYRMLFKTVLGAHIYDVMNCVNFHEYKSFVLKNYPLKRYFQAFAIQMNSLGKWTNKKKVLFLRAYEIERHKTFDLPKEVLENLKYLKRKDLWNDEELKYYEEAQKYMLKYVVDFETFLKEGREMHDRIIDELNNVDTE